tara:strand:- start:2656 stop:2994 length:339 start_codon:yes stop_codon:yes gene_type:complete
MATAVVLPKRLMGDGSGMSDFHNRRAETQTKKKSEPRLPWSCDEYFCFPFILVVTLEEGASVLFPFIVSHLIKRCEWIERKKVKKPLLHFLVSYRYGASKQSGKQCGTLFRE